MSKLVAKSFQNRATFYKHIATMSDKFDVEESLRQPYFCFVTTEGKEYRSKILAHFLSAVNEECGTKFIISRSVTRRNAFIVWYEEETPALVEETPIGVIVEGVVEEVFVEGIVTTEEVDLSVPDEPLDSWLDEAKALYDSSDKSGSKIKLEALGRTMNVELNRSKTFAKMIDELVEKTS